MAIIVNPSWKSKKEGDSVSYKGVDYTIGSDAFGSLQAAALAGATSDLVIVDKKLTSPVSKVAITQASSDIFVPTVKETKSKDETTTTTTVKFTATAGGTATINETDAELIGFDKVTANKTGGNFYGGKQDVSSSVKTVENADKGISTADKSVTVSSKATGTLSVSGTKDSIANVAVGGILDMAGSSEVVDPENATASAIAIISDGTEGVYTKFFPGEEYKPHASASYASVTLKNAASESDFVGGTITEKATLKTSSTNNDENKSAQYTYSISGKIGSGTATLTDAGAGALSGYKTVKVTISSAAAGITVGNIEGGNDAADYTLKTAYTAEKSSSYDYSVKTTTSVAGAVTLTGKKADNRVTAGDLKLLSSATLNWATVDAIDSFAGSSKSTYQYSIKAQKENAAYSYTSNWDSTATAGGTLTAGNTIFNGNIFGMKTATIKDSAFNSGNDEVLSIYVSATNSKHKSSSKKTGFTADGIVEDAYTATLDRDQAFSTQYTSKDEYSVGGTSFKVSGKAAEASFVNVAGYKTVALDNTNTAEDAVLTASIYNTNKTTDFTEKESFTPEKSYSWSEQSTETKKAVGDATIKGNTAAYVSGFASVKATGTNYATTLNGVSGQRTKTEKDSESVTIKAGKNNPLGSYTESETATKTVVSTLEATKVTVNGTLADLKTVKLTNVKGSISAANEEDKTKKSSTKISWNADAISRDEVWKYDEEEGEYLEIPGAYDEKVTSADISEDRKESVTGSFTLKNTDENAVITSLGVEDFKTVDITLSTTNEIAGGSFGRFDDEDGHGDNKDITKKKTVKRSITDKKRTQSINDSSSFTSVGTLSITGKTKGTATTALVGPAAPAEAEAEEEAAAEEEEFKPVGMNYSKITLKDVAVSNYKADSHAETYSTTISETATLDSGSVTAVTYKASITGNVVGNGTFTASTTNAEGINAFAGSLSGYSVTITKSDVSIGSAENYKQIGTRAAYVPVREYFDPIAGNPDDLPEDAEYLEGNISGSYTLDSKGQVTSSWKADYAEVSSGSFSQEGKTMIVSVDSVEGFDSVTLTGVEAGTISGANYAKTTVLTYKTAKDEVVADSAVVTASYTSASKVTLAGKKIGTLQYASAESIAGYKTVTVTDAAVAGDIIAGSEDDEYGFNIKTVTATDNVESTITTASSRTAVGSATITGTVKPVIPEEEAELAEEAEEAEEAEAITAAGVGGDIKGFSNVTLSKVVLGNGGEVEYVGGNRTVTTVTDLDEVVISENIEAASAGKLAISDAIAEEGTEFTVSGFKMVDINFANAAEISSIQAGTLKSEALYDGGEQVSGKATFTTAGNTLKLTTVQGSVKGSGDDEVPAIAGFATVTITDTDIEDATIWGYDLSIEQKEGEDPVTKKDAKATVTFDNTIEGEDSATTIAGVIDTAKKVVFTASTADEDIDFDVTAGEISATTVEVKNCEAVMDLTVFDLADTNGLFTLNNAEVSLSGLDSVDDAADYFAGFEGATLKGIGNAVFLCGFEVTDAEMKDALKGLVTFNGTVTFQGPVVEEA